jgi:hypothetical protein
MTSTSEAEAFAMHDQLLRENPGLKGKIQVMSSFELN